MEGERKPRLVSLSQAAFLVKVKDRFRGRQKGTEEDWNFLAVSEMWQFQGRTKAWGVAVELGSEVQLGGVLSEIEVRMHVVKVSRVVAQDGSRTGESYGRSRASWSPPAVPFTWLRLAALAFLRICAGPPVLASLCLYPCQVWRTSPLTTEVSRHTFSLPTLVFPPSRSMKKDYRHVGCRCVGPLNSVTILSKSGGSPFPVSSIKEITLSSLASITGG